MRDTGPGIRRRFLADPETGEHTFGRGRLLAILVWLAFIVAPPINAIGERGSGLGHATVIVAAVLFAVLYAWLAFSWQPGRERPRRAALLAGALLALTIGLVVGDGPSWGFLFTYSAACTALVIPTEWGFAAVTAIAGMAVGISVLAGGHAGDAAGYAISSVGVGLIMVLLRGLRVRNAELMEARAELARTAVTAERERFARDLHDLLGHSLSVITLKAELAGRLLEVDPERAADEVGDIERVARGALGEVREAVSGYRRPTLAGELEGARVALTAAGIDVAVEGEASVLESGVEAVLGWAVREGATNVIRHSGARHCRVSVRATLDAAAIEVVDDGGGCASAGHGGAGNGLAGLDERARELGGRMEAGSLPQGGFRLAVSIPRHAPASVGGGRRRQPAGATGP